MTDETTTTKAAPMTEDELQRAYSGECPRCGQSANYDSSEYGGGETWQDATCSACGIAWREIARVQSVTQILSENGDEGEIFAHVNEAAEVDRIEPCVTALCDLLAWADSMAARYEPSGYRSPAREAAGAALAKAEGRE